MQSGETRETIKINLTANAHKHVSFSGMSQRIISLRSFESIPRQVGNEKQDKLDILNNLRMRQQDLEIPLLLLTPSNSRQPDHGKDETDNDGFPREPRYCR